LIPATPDEYSASTGQLLVSHAPATGRLLGFDLFNVFSAAFERRKHKDQKGMDARAVEKTLKRVELQSASSGTHPLA